MSDTARRIKVGLSVTALGALAAGCSGGNNSDSNSGPGTVVTSQEDSFSTVFGTAFRASPDSTPIIPKDGDIIPLTLDSDPKPIT
ncbi:MAG: hypothetical protein JWO15_967 [Sphingomonadales bacterium]|nr:hypothetical protein [Sphingomonadales bacterium]